ncbi:MAG TPA: TadA family conjugal transfer-associated ATPase [Mycobacteriales bacterium]|nr:TadA family conjugal transfer-associated ATPase [Mycobacteriales bacterium]
MRELDPELAARVRQRLARSDGPVTTAQVAAVLRSETQGVVGDVALLELVRAAQSEFVGAGPLEPLLRDPQMTDVLVNGPGEVWVDRGDGLQCTDIRFADEDAVRRLAVRLASAAGRRLDDAQPWVDATLRDGTRLHAVLPPIAAGGTCLSLRVLRSRSFTLAELIAGGSLTPDGARLLEALIAARLAFLVTGGTGSGKTTLLGSLLGLVDPGERIVLVEDAGELRPQHPHLVGLVARPPNVENAGAVTLRDLVRQALRMRPDRVVVGEVRGAEVVDLLAALNTGHDGGCGTIHANGIEELPARLEALGALGGLGRAALHSQVAAAIQVVVHVARGSDGRRQVRELGILERAGEHVQVRTAWRCPSGAGPAMPELARLLAARGVPV